MVIKLDIEVGDIVLTGRFKNKRTKVKTIGTDEFGHPTINGKPILKLRIEKLMPKNKQSKQTRKGLAEMTITKTRLQKLAGVLKEQVEDVDNKEVELWKLGTENPFDISDSAEIRIPIEEVAEFLGVTPERVVAAYEALDDWDDTKMTDSIEDGYYIITSGRNV